MVIIKPKPLIALAVVLALLSIGGYFLLKQQPLLIPSQEQEVVQESIGNTSDLSPDEVLQDWNTHYDKELGLEFSYPAEYNLTFGQKSRNKSINFIASHQKLGNSIARELMDSNRCFWGLCDKPPESQLFVNNISWDFLGLQKYCDAGACSPNLSVYRTTRTGYRYYIFFENENYEEKILQTFKFIE